VFPCEPGAKRPLTRNGHWDATTDSRVIERWWKRWPSANVGIPTGKKSGVVVLDVDMDAGGLDSLAKLERTGTPIPKTARARTGGGGIHVFFRNPRGTKIRNSAGLLGPGLDVRGDGGYSVLRGVRVSPRPRLHEDDRSARLQPRLANQVAASRAMLGGTTWPPSNSR
jgi:hypothetical protein